MLIERKHDNTKLIKKYYENSSVIFENCVLLSDKLYYSICYYPKLDLYDVLLIDNKNDKLINFESRKKLSNSTLKYFNVYKDDTLEDNFDNKFKCLTHHIRLYDN